MVFLNFDILTLKNNGLTLLDLTMAVQNAGADVACC